MIYRYTISGTAADDQTWTVSGLIQRDRRGSFSAVCTEAQQCAFDLLTQGKATYGHPGEGCNGPYRMTRLLVELT